MNKEREIDGIKVIVSNETYNEYKGTFQDQINELQDRIDNAIEYIEDNSTNTYLLKSFDIDILLNILKGEK